MRARDLPLLAPALLAAALAGCGSASRTVSDLLEEDGAPSERVDIASIPNATPRAEPRSRYGNPDSYEVFGRRYYVLPSAKGYKERGIASWYGTKFHGRRTSSGEPYDMHQMTAAHKTLPLPTYARVTNLTNGRSVIVKINDRGPFHDNRIIDLSHTAAVKLGITGKGTGFVEVEAIDPATWGRPAPTTTASQARPAASAAAAARSDFYLQVGAFTQRGNAERMIDRLAAAELGGARIEPIRVDGVTLFRVRLGPLADPDEADRLAQRIADAGLPTPRVVSD